MWWLRDCQRIAHPVRLPAWLVSVVVGRAAMASLPTCGFAALRSLGGAAPLYLLTEELLAEAHEVEHYERPWVTACFFLGSLVVLILEPLIGAG